VKSEESVRKEESEYEIRHSDAGAGESNKYGAQSR